VTNQRLKVVGVALLYRIVMTNGMSVKGAKQIINCSLQAKVLFSFKSAMKQRQKSEMLIEPNLTIIV
jgi:hypothetical protein